MAHVMRGAKGAVRQSVVEPAVPFDIAMRRPDLTDLVRYAVETGLTVALTPSGTAASGRLPT